MSTMLAYCGLPCESCPIHLATLEPDAERRGALRREIARECTEVYGMPTRPQDVDDCDGCRAGARLFSGCRACLVRPCAAGRAVETCADCPAYPCATLEPLLAREPQARARLDALRG